jgi:hypothetical protein
MAFQVPAHGLPNWLAMDRDIDRAIVAGGVAVKLTLATLPDAAEWEGRIVRITDESGGDTLAWSDGTDWRRMTDNAIAS